MSIWVVNTSPLVFLGNLGRLELLRHEGREVYIPRAVAEEIAEKPNHAKITFVRHSACVATGMPSITCG